MALGSVALARRPYELPERLGARVPHGFVQTQDPKSDLAVFLVFSAIRFAVGLEAASLVQVKQRSADMVQWKGFVQRQSAQWIGIERPKKFAFGGIGRK